MPKLLKKKSKVRLEVLIRGFMIVYYSLRNQFWEVMARKFLDDYQNTVVSSISKFSRGRENNVSQLQKICLCSARLVEPECMLQIILGGFITFVINSIIIKYHSIIMDTRQIR